MDQPRKWVYLVMVVFITIPIYGAFHAIPIFLDIFMNEYGGSHTIAGWIGSIFLFCWGISSLVGVYLHTLFGLRRVISASAVVFAFLSTPRMPKLEYLFLTFSIPFGFAVGFYECGTFIFLREYFSKKLGLATGIRYASVQGGGMIFSYLVPIIYDLTGWQTMMTSFFVLGLMFIGFAVLYKPVLNNGDPTLSLISVDVSQKEEKETEINVLQTTKLLLKDTKVLILLAGIALFSVVQYTASIFMIQYAQSLGFPLSKSKWFLVILSSSSLISRICFATFADCVMKLHIIRILLSAVIISFGLSSFLVSFTQSFTLLAVYMSGIGVLDGMYCPMFSTAALEIRYQHSDIIYTLMLTAAAFGYLVGPPAIELQIAVNDVSKLKSFKVLKLALRARIHPDKFDWNLFQKERKLGSGSFSAVYLGTYNNENRVLTKIMKGESMESRSRFLKEANLLNSTKGHKNIVEFLGFCDEPCSIMMEYLCFNFGPFGVEKVVSTLDDFLHFVDQEFDFTSFADILAICAKDIVNGIEYLHGMNIAHRDLKPGNILVSNQHLTSDLPIAICEMDFSNMYAKSPIVCKLADFGLSRSLEIQTKTMYCNYLVFIISQFNVIGTGNNDV